MIAIWFSCGAASAVAAKLTVERYGQRHDVRLLNNPVDEEDSDNRRFAADVAAWVGLPLELVVNRKLGHTSAERVWVHESYMAGPAGAPCTGQLKREARHQWENSFHPDWHVLGFTADEHHRHDRFVLTERSNILPVLIDAGFTKADCFKVLLRAGLRLPRKYAEGYPNGNCLGCVKANSPRYWNLVRVRDPEVFAARAVLSRQMGVRLVRINRNGERIRIFLDELDPNEKGGNLKGLDFDCGVFCEEKPWTA
jgi:hypothetical protein